MVGGIGSHHHNLFSLGVRNGFNGQVSLPDKEGVERLCVGKAKVNA